MARGGDSTGLKVSLIVMGMLLVVSFFFMYTKINEANTVTQELQAVQKELTGAQSTSKKLTAEMLQIQDLLGTGESDAAEAIENIKTSLNTYAGNLATPNVLQTFAAMRDELNNQESRAGALQKNLDEAKKKNIDQDRIAQATIAKHQEARQKADKDLQEVKRQAEETVASYRQQNEELNDEKFRIQTELDELRESTENKIAELETEKRRLLNTVASLQEEVALLQDTSYEIADGRIIRADFHSGLVYINLGSAQGLTPRTRFSVYIKKNRGVARGTEEVKGAIEVTEILGKHEAVARIIDEDLARPIAANDPIYSPAWSANDQLSISIVGLIDLDGDGQLDRDRFHELMALNNAIVDNEVDDDGVRTGDGISVQTKFLVVGDIPDLTKAESLPEEITQIKAISDAHTDMVQEARAQGVRVITLRDFLQYLGYRPTQRIWMRGAHGEWNLNLGRRLSKAAVESGKYHSSGTVAPLFTRSKKLPPVTSKFTPVSKLFKNVERSYP